MPEVSFPTANSPISVVVADFNADGNSDLATSNIDTPDTVSVLLGNGDGTFGPTQSFATGNQTGGAAEALKSGDFNDDGFPDLVVVNTDSGTVAILLGAENGTTFELSGSYTVGLLPRDVAVADFDADGMLDLATASTFSFGVSVLLGTGDGSFSPAETYVTGANPDSIVSVDFDGDGKTDIATANLGDGDVTVLFGVGDGSFQAPVPSSPIGELPHSITAADFDADGLVDWAATNSSSNQLAVLLNTSCNLVPGDVNQDGTVDLLDVEPFVTILGEGVFQVEADINQDGVVNLLDVQPFIDILTCLLYTSPSPRDLSTSRMPSSA